jgi:transposase
VCAPGKTDRPAADRVKTDKRDAIRLARLLAAGELTLVTIPSVEREQLRDLVRCREDIRLDLMRARNRIGKFCCAARSTGRGGVRRGRASTAPG